MFLSALNAAACALLGELASWQRAVGRLGLSFSQVSSSPLRRFCCRLRQCVGVVECEISGARELLGMLNPQSLIVCNDLARALASSRRHLKQNCLALLAANHTRVAQSLFLRVFVAQTLQTGPGAADFSAVAHARPLLIAWSLHLRCVGVKSLAN